MKKIRRLLALLMMALMVAAPFMSFATDADSVAASGNGSEVAAAGDEDSAVGPTGGEAGDQDDSAAVSSGDTEAAETDKEDNKDAADTESDKGQLPTEPTEVTVVASIEELSSESEAAYDNDAFFTIDASKDKTSADLATDEVSEGVAEILSGDAGTSEKKEEIVEVLEDSGLYHAEESGKSKVDVTSKFAYQRLRLIAPEEAEINAYGATRAVYYKDSYLLSYDSIEATMQAYDALAAEYGSDSVLIDMPMKISGNEKGWGTSFMRMDYQKTVAAGGSNVIVAVIDTGIRKDHQVFSGRDILPGYDFVNSDSDPSDDNGHGTAVSGVIAESTPSNVKIMPLKALQANGEGSTFDVHNAIQYAEQQHADIINMSLGGYLETAEALNSYNAEYSSYKALIVCASGNEGKDMDAQGVYEFPGEISSTVCVGSITAGKDLSSFSNYGQAVDFAAPGSSVMLASLDGSYSYNSGTSFSSPYLASAAAVVKAGHDAYSNAEIIEVLEGISEDLGTAGRDVYFGNGCPRFEKDPDHQRGWDIGSKGVTTTISDIHNKTYNGSAHTQKPSIISNGEVLEQGIDYDISYSNNVNAGTAGMTITGKGDFSGKIEGITFTINPKSITPSVTLSGTTFNYTGKAITPGVTVKDGSKVLANGTDYTVSYSSNVNAGTGYAKVTCKGNYSGSNTASFRIKTNNTYYQLSSGTVISRTSTTAVFSWKMNRELTDGSRITINGIKVNPTKNGDTYTFNVNGFNPAKSYSIPVKVVDKDGKAVSNEIKVAVDTYYKLSSGTVTSTTPTTAVFSWKMNLAPTDDYKVTINGIKVNPTRNGDTYTYNVNGFNPAKTYSIPVKVVDKDGKAVSNEIKIAVDTSYKLSSGTVTSRTATTAVFSWKMNRVPTDDYKVTINGHKVNPTRNGDTYTCNVNGFNPAKSYSIPVKVVDKDGKAVSNEIKVAVDTYYKLSSGTVTSRTPTTAVFSWKMNRAPTDDYKVTINGIKVNPTRNGDTYTYNVNGFNPAKAYSIPVKVVDKNGRTISNTMNVSVGKT